MDATERTQQPKNAVWAEDPIVNLSPHLEGLTCLATYSKTLSDGPSLRAHLPPLDGLKSI